MKWAPVRVTKTRQNKNLKLVSDAIRTEKVLISTQSDNGLRQGGQEQHDADAEQDDILEEKLAGQVPGHRVRGKAPFYDTGRGEEERPGNRKGTHADQRASGRQNRNERTRRQQCRGEEFDDTKQIRLPPQPEYRQPPDKWAVADVLSDALRRLQREFLHAERNKDDDHDPAQDRQRPIRPAPAFCDVERCFHLAFPEFDRQNIPCCCQYAHGGAFVTRVSGSPLTMMCAEGRVGEVGAHRTDR